MRVRKESGLAATCWLPPFAPVFSLRYELEAAFGCAAFEAPLAGMAEAASPPALFLIMAALLLDVCAAEPLRLAITLGLRVKTL